MGQKGHRLRNGAVCAVLLLALLATGVIAGGQNGVVEDPVYPIFGGKGSNQLSKTGPSCVTFTGSAEEQQEMSAALEQARRAGWTLKELTQVEGPSFRDYDGPPEAEGDAALYDGRQHLQEHYSGSGDYNASFTCDPADGNRLNVWVSNTGETSLYVNIEWTTLFGVIVKKYPARTLAPGEQNTSNFYYENDTGIDGTWNVNVTTQLGGAIDIDVAARQYQENP